MWDYVEYVLTDGKLSEVEKIREMKLEDVYKFLYFKLEELKSLEGE